MISKKLVLVILLVLTTPAALANLSVDEAKSDVVGGLLQLYSANRSDVKRSDVQVQTQADGSVRAWGSITIGWTEPRNVGEAARIAANQNRCAFASANCTGGIQHVIYFDLKLDPGPQSKWNGEYSYDMTLDEKRAADMRTALDGQRAAAATAERDHDQAAKTAAAREATKRKNLINVLLSRQKEERHRLSRHQADEIAAEISELSDRFRALKSQRYFSQEGRELQDAIAAKNAELTSLGAAESGDPSMLRKVDPVRAEPWETLLSHQERERASLRLSEEQSP